MSSLVGNPTLRGFNADFPYRCLNVLMPLSTYMRKLCQESVITFGSF